MKGTSDEFLRWGWCAVAAVGLWITTLPLHAADTPGLKVLYARTELVDEVYHLDARLRFRLSAAALEALENGVPLTFEVNIEVLRERDYLWDEETASLTQRYRLRYHALSQQYILKNLNSGVQRNYATREAALDALGIIEKLPMLDRRLLKVGERYRARLRARLDIEALPSPLRPLAYLSSQWRLVSDWYTWSLES